MAGILCLSHIKEARAEQSDPAVFLAVGSYGFYPQESLIVLPGCWRASHLYIPCVAGPGAGESRKIVKQKTNKKPHTPT